METGLGQVVFIIQSQLYYATFYKLTCVIVTCAKFFSFSSVQSLSRV